MKLDSEKCHLLISCVKQAMWAKTGEDIRWEKSDVKLLGVTIDKNLGFDEHILKLCSKANRKLSAIFRRSRFLSLDRSSRLQMFFKIGVLNNFALFTKFRVLWILRAFFYRKPLVPASV